MGLAGFIILYVFQHLHSSIWNLYVHIFYRDFLEAYERPKGESETGENDDLSQEGEQHFRTDPCNTTWAKVHEPEFLNFLGAQESNQFRQPM